MTVGVVALPLALGFGVGSGMGATAGIITAIVAGIVAAIFGGSNLQVSGPTGAMTVVLVPVIAEHGVTTVPLLAVMAGLLVLLAGACGLGRAVTLIPWPVIEGFTLGIGAIIFLQQVPLVLRTAPADHHDTLRATWHAVRTAEWGAAVPAICVTLVVVVWLVACRRAKPTFPASLIGVIGAAIACTIFDVDVPRIGTIDLAGISFGIDVPSPGVLDDLLSAAAVIALLAALESLLSARVADGMADTSDTDPDRELVGQGLANIAAGLVGGMPATGAIARTAVNARAGARTRAASFFHGVVLLIVLVGASALVADIPLAALAAVLMVTAVRMVDLSTARVLLRSTRSDALVFTATAFMTIAFDLVLAVEVGVAAAIVLALRSSARSSSIQEEQLAVDVDHLDDAELHALLDRHVVVYRLQGSLFFGAAQRFLEEITALDQARVVVLRLGSLHLLDATGAHALIESIEALHRRGIKVLVCGLQAQHRQVLEAVGIPGEHLTVASIFTELPRALDAAKRLATR
ncbi:MAG: sulfate transporter [Thermoleophilia bacterium]|nr:sulfate transporter [Thermoleophilia bacterium]